MCGFALVSAGLAVFCVVWSWGQLVVLCGFGSVSAGLGPFCIVLGWSRPATLRLYSFVLFWAGLSWSWLVSLRVVLFCLTLCCFGLVSAALAAFGLVLYCFGLVSAGFAVLYGFMYFVLVSPALAASCLVLGWSLPVSLFCAGFALLC